MHSLRGRERSARRVSPPPNSLKQGISEGIFFLPPQPMRKTIARIVAACALLCGVCAVRSQSRDAACLGGDASLRSAPRNRDGQSPARQLTFLLTTLRPPRRFLSFLLTVSLRFLTMRMLPC